jgi:hypothetical protein
MWIERRTSSGFKFTHTKHTILIFYHHNGTALFLPVILVSLIVVLALLAAFVSVVAVVLCCSCLLSVCCNFTLLQHPPTDDSVTNPMFLLRTGSSTKRSTIDPWSTSSGSDSICSQGYVMDCFFAIQRSFLSSNRCFQKHHWKPSTTSFSTLLPYTKAPSTLFGSVRLCTPSLVDLERILEAILLSRTYSKLHNLLGIVPLFPMVMVYIPQPMSQI